jgi:hypothetical protein
MTKLITVETQSNITELSIAAWAVSNVEEKLAKINKRAKRLKMAPITFEVVKRWEKETGKVYLDGTKQKIEMCDLRIVGQKPTLSGFQLLGRIDHNGFKDGSANLLLGDIPETYRKAAPDCDHCKKARNRKDTFIFRNEFFGQPSLFGVSEKLEFIQVGRSCLKDFFDRSVSSLLAYCDFVAEIAQWDEDSFGGGGRAPTDIVAFLAATRCAVRTSGWMSATAAREQGGGSTRDEAWMILNPPKAPYNEGIPKPVAEDYEYAQKALKWVRELPEADRSFGYMANLWASCLNCYLGKRQDGIVASLVGAAFPRAMEKEVERKRRASEGDLPTSAHMGSIGERLKGMNVSLSHEPRYFPNDYAGTTLLKFRDANGNDFTWFASGDRTLWDVGTELELTGTVKKHDSYKGRDFTVLNRCKIQAK